MYVCVCNAITELQVRAAIDAGATNWTDVHLFHGHEPNCGKCACEIGCHIANFKTTSDRQFNRTF